jgi:Transposase-associated domain
MLLFFRWIVADGCMELDEILLNIWVVLKNLWIMPLKIWVKKGDQTILYPCRDCQNLRIFRNVKEVRVHLIRHGFKERYTKQIWHGDNSEEYMNVGMSRDVLNSETIVHDESGGENIYFFWIVGLIGFFLL